MAYNTEMTATEILKDIGEAGYASGSNVHSVLSSVLKASMTPEVKGISPMIKTIKIKCNSVRGRNISCGGIDTYFDEQGLAVVAAYRLPEIQAEMDRRPGRFTLVEEVAEFSEEETAAIYLEAARKGIEEESTSDEDKKSKKGKKV